MGARSVGCVIGFTVMPNGRLRGGRLKPVADSRMMRGSAVFVNDLSNQENELVAVGQVIEFTLR